MTPRRSEAFWLALALGVGVGLFVARRSRRRPGRPDRPVRRPAVHRRRRDRAAARPPPSSALVVVLALLAGVVGRLLRVVRAPAEDRARRARRAPGDPRRHHPRSAPSSAPAWTAPWRARWRRPAADDAAGSRILAAVAQALEWDAAALWEVDGATGTLRCTATWQSPDGRLQRFEEFSARHASSRSGIGLPGACSQAASRSGSTTSAQDDSPARGAGRRRRSACARSRRSRSWASAARARWSTCSPAAGGPPTPALMKGMAHGRPLHRPAPVPAPRRGGGAARRGAARSGARVRARLRDHDEPRGAHRGVQPGRGAHVRLSARRRGGPARWPRSLLPERLRDDHRARARALPDDRREQDPRASAWSWRGCAPTARSSRSRSRSCASATEEPPMFAGYLRDVTGAQARRGKHAAPGRDRRALQRRGRRRRAWTGGSSPGTRRGAPLRLVRRRSASACRSPTPRPRTAATRPTTSCAS